IRAIFEAQKEIHHGVSLSIPILVMHSDRSTHPKKWHLDAQSSDIVLDVKHIAHYAQKIQGDVTLCDIKKGLHDLVLSEKSVREQVYRQLFAWLQQKGV
ncbi:MAG: alpha/beta hydrolase, partial [Acinetobacter sp.]|nr:alpha/beta hydrolase [Acinetobacter sp.]